MSITASLSYFSRTALNGIWRSPFVHVIAVASLAIALVGYGLARMASSQLDKLLYALGGEVEMTVYLAEGTTPEKIADLQSALSQRTGGQTKVVSPAEALGRLAHQLGDQGDALTVARREPAAVERRGHAASAGARARGLDRPWPIGCARCRS